MTDKPEKPTTPGMAEVSAKFEHEARSRNPMLDRIDQIEEESRRVDAMPASEENDLAVDRVTESEVRVFQTRAETLPDLLAKARMAYRISIRSTASGKPLEATDAPRVTVADGPNGGVGGLDDEVLIWSLLQDIEGLSKGAVASRIKTPVAATTENPAHDALNGKVDLNEMMRREDEELYRLVNLWEATYYKYLVADEDRLGLTTQIEALEGQILRYTPATFLGLVMILQMAHKIMSARDGDPDCYLTGGPATPLIARAIDAIDHEDGVIGGTETV